MNSFTINNKCIFQASGGAIMVSGSDVLIKNSHVEANEAAVRRCQRNDATIAIYSTV